MKGIVALLFSICVVSAVRVLRPDEGGSCNGSPKFCNRRYSEVTVIGAHNSFTNDPNPVKKGADQNVDVLTQLEMGVRLLQGQAHWRRKEEELYLCHTTCKIFNGGPLEDYLRKVKRWLDMPEHRNEVVTLLINNKSKKDVEAFWHPVYWGSGVAAMAWVQPKDKTSCQDWPTLAEMINRNKRIVVFMDYVSDQDRVPYIHDEFRYIWEDPYSQTRLDRSCKVDRPKNTDVTGKMNLINHVKNRPIIPGTKVVRSDRRYILKTNSIQSILEHAERCSPLAGGLQPNFVLVDFVDQGRPLLAADILNGVITMEEAQAKSAGDPDPHYVPDPSCFARGCRE